MLAERYYQLLTAYVDGELSARQRKAVQRLLRKSSEARVLLRQLQGDADAVRRLPRPRLNPDFPQRVVGTIAERGLRSARQPAAGVQPRRSFPWLGWAAAAVVLVSVSGLSYLVYPLLVKKERRDAPVAVKPQGPAKATDLGPRDAGPPPDPISKDSLAKGPKKDTGNGSRPDNENKSDDQRSPRDSGKGSRDSQPKNDPDTVTAPPKGDGDRLKIELPRLSVMAELRDFEGKEIRAKLLAQLQKGEAHYLKLFCPNTARTLEQLRSVLAHNGMALVIDREVQNRMQRRTKPNLTLYSENVTPDEVVNLFQQLAKAEQTAAARSKVASPSAFLVATDLPDKIRQQAAKFLRIPPGGKSPPPKPPAAGSGRSLLVVPYFEEDAPFPPRAARSKEVQQYRSGRAKPLPGTVQVVLVLLRDKGKS
jgi:hypothetical protein